MFTRIVGLVGPIRAGKSTISQILVDDFGYSAASNSALLGSILEGMQIEKNRSNLGALGNALFEVLGNDVLAHYRIRTLGDSKVVIDGIRYEDEIKAYSSIPGFLLIAVESHPADRLQRINAKSGEDKDPGHTNLQALRRMDGARSEVQVPLLMEMAHVRIQNNGNLAALRANVHEIMKPRAPPR